MSKRDMRNEEVLREELRRHHLDVEGRELSVKEADEMLARLLEFFHRFGKWVARERNKGRPQQPGAGA